MNHAGRFQQDAGLGKGCKVDIVGAGLAGRLTAIALISKWPALDVRIIEPANSDGPSRTWCFHEGDLRPGTLSWLEPLICKRWSGYDVYFPKHRRQFTSGYYAIQSERFFSQTNALLQTRISTQARGDAEFTFVTTGWPKSNDGFGGGWQKFVGLDVTLEEPHGLLQPILMDATVEQVDGYRFFYCLPWSARSLLIEDTYYSNAPSLDLEKIKSRIRAFASLKGWKIKSVDRVESGSLPLAVSPSLQANVHNSVALGAASGLAHPVTGYTTSILFRQLEALIGVDEPSEKNFQQAIISENARIRKGFSYLHLLNQMMFRASRPEERYRILERFYTLPADLIARFYASELTLADRVRLLIGKPPVPLAKGARAFVEWSLS